ncbi:glycosyl transferase family 2 [Salinarchaeum chitinilyticum]
MEYVQERVATLHDLGGTVPEAPLSETAVVVPTMPREIGRPAAEHTFETLAELDVGRVVVPVRAPAERIGEIRAWLRGFDLPLTVLWCNGPAVEQLLADAGLTDADLASDGDEPTQQGKGADVWLGLGVAASGAGTHDGADDASDVGYPRDAAAASGPEYVVVHDADATSYDAGHVPRLVAPLAGEFSFSKGYYARVEDDGLYGRLFRLFYEPLLAALDDVSADPAVDYFGAFRYALAGEFAMTADLARSMRAQRAWGLEIGTLGEAFRLAGAAGSAQVDLGIHRHDHRSVDGDGGLASMSEQVGAALFRALADQDVDPDYEELRTHYREHGDRLVEQYAADAAHNGLSFDRAAEREQVRAYADAIRPPGADSRLPAWTEVSLEPAAVLAASERALANVDAASSPHRAE